LCCYNFNGEVNGSGLSCIAVGDRKRVVVTFDGYCGGGKVREDDIWRVLCVDPRRRGHYRIVIGTLREGVGEREASVCVGYDEGCRDGCHPGRDSWDVLSRLVFRDFYGSDGGECERCYRGCAPGRSYLAKVGKQK